MGIERRMVGVYVRGLGEVGRVAQPHGRECASCSKVQHVTDKRTRERVVIMRAKRKWLWWTSRDAAVFTLALA